MIITNAIQDAPSASTDPVTRRYKPHANPTDMDNQNLDKARAIIRLFGLNISEVAKAGGISRPYLSRALPGTLAHSPKFWRTLERNLGRLVEE